MATSLPLPAWIDASSAETRAHLRAPERRIKAEEDMDVWRASAAHDEIVLFLMRLSEASVNAPTRDVAWNTASAMERASSHDPIDRVIALLQKLDTWTDEIEPQTSAQRFGNLSFRTWGKRLEETIEALHKELLPEPLQPFALELRAYFFEAFGSFVRIDYGTGHELNFVAWLDYLHRLHFFVDSAEADAVRHSEERLALEVFPAYLRVVWHLQDRYSLEPAGSHGVWGLDDYQFVPYILGAAQLRDSTSFTPQSVISRTLYPFVSQPGPRSGPRISVEATLMYTPPGTHAPVPNLYISSLARIHSLKRGAFAEHSPLLTDISTNVPSWYKVYTGMLKMYDAECLLKQPVVQHFVFSGVGFQWPDAGPTAHAGRATAHPAGLGSVSKGPLGVPTSVFPGSTIHTPHPHAPRPGTGLPRPGGTTARPGTGAPWAGGVLPHPTRRPFPPSNT
ncbi:hypothetical protein CBS9595_003570 [Malassezia furfur]|nr:hypothetical protein CBS9595_003570 [Malassezia furfur]